MVTMMTMMGMNKKRAMQPKPKKEKVPKPQQKTEWKLMSNIERTRAGHGLRLHSCLLGVEGKKNIEPKTEKKKKIQNKL